MKLLSIQVGQPLPLGHLLSAIRKDPVAGPVLLRQAGLDGDEQADHAYHGGPAQAVLCYAAAHYPKWRQELGLEMGPGGFGENFTVEDGDEWSVCIGDLYEVGGATVEVTKPRAPCFKIGLRWNMPRLVRLVHESGRHGWYLRVLREGIIEAGQEMRLIQRPHPDLTVRAVADRARPRKVPA